MKTKKRERGDWGEAAAVSFLLDKKYRVIAQNYATRRGEIDIIAWHEKRLHGPTLCFVEVKTRAENDGSAERATNQEKLSHLFYAAKQYCLDQAIDIDRTPIQFEQVSVYGDGRETPTLEHYVIPVH